jgi:hypothetical protein
MGMKGAGMGLLAAALLLGGCASRAERWADSEFVICKHCNCFMPADIPPDSICPVCDCGYTAAECQTGTFDPKFVLTE